MENISISGKDQYSLSLAVFESQDARAVIQMVHGMEEHKERYYEFIQYLVDRHFHVVISDLRGHGSDAPILSHIADKHGAELLIEDQKEITRWIENRYPGLPKMLFAHSMGTIISRVLLQTDSKLYSAAALSGYVNPNAAASVAVLIGNVVKTLKGSRSQSKLLTSLALGPFTKSIKDRKTDADWLSYNEENVRKYIEDPLSGKEFTVGSYQALFQLLKQMADAQAYKNVNQDLPVLLIAGKDDPCTGGEKGRTDSKNILEKAGFHNILVTTYEHMRHEILQEKENRRVYEDLADFFTKAIPQAH